MTDDDALPDPLARLIDELARADAGSVLEEARACARERVRERLTDELARRMVEHMAAERTSTDPSTPTKTREAPAPDPTATAAARPPSPPRDEPASTTAVYVYAVARAGTGPATRGMRGIGDAPVRILTSDAVGLEALVSDVPLEEFSDEALKRNLNDLPWLSAAALRHEATVEAAMAETTLVPLRMCTIFRDDEGVREMLAREAPALAAALTRLHGAHEWGVKVIADTEAFSAAVARAGGGTSPLPGDPEAGEGAGYFAALRRDRATREEVVAELDRRTREMHEAVAALAIDTRLHPASSRELSGYDGEMVLNGAYLVPADRTDDLRALTRSLAEQHRADGLTVDLTGPWPPYNFSMPAGGL